MGMGVESSLSLGEKNSVLGNLMETFWPSSWKPIKEKPTALEYSLHSRYLTMVCTLSFLHAKEESDYFPDCIIFMLRFGDLWSLDSFPFNLRISDSILGIWVFLVLSSTALSHFLCQHFCHLCD